MIIALADHTIEIDLTHAEQELLRIELRTGAKAINGRLQPTASLLMSVAQWLESLGLKGCSLSSAWQFWWSIYERVDRLREQHAANAELAFWYGINPFSLSDDERAALLANMDRVKAQSTLHHGNFSPTDYKYIHAITLLATGDELQANRARATALEAYVDSKIAKGKR